jgi:UDP-GlcNAc:undecaprenyl-phosphate/decaprenyl-phosphate GlcNAc-1-phosphate transferase
LHSLLVVVLLGILFSFLVIKFGDRIFLSANESDLTGVQKFHTEHTSRVGGIPVFVSFFVGLWFALGASEWLLFLFLVSLPVFVGGLAEDIASCVSPFKRLLITFLSIVIAFFVLDIKIESLGFVWIDQILSTYLIISLLFTLLVVAGSVNSFNIIDGFNGLLGGYAILVCLAIAYVAYILGDTLVFQMSSILAASLFGFLIFNFPFGKIFMGDGGAYFVGFMVSIIGLMLGIRHDEVSHWFVLLLFIYPLYETVFSIYRRKIIHDTDASQPDANHLHSLVYRKFISCDRFKHKKVICNSMVSPLMWLLSLTGIIPAVIWFDNQMALIIWAFIFMVIYTIIYKYISSERFKFNH